jgi:hypothetical protein
VIRALVLGAALLVAGNAWAGESCDEAAAMAATSKQLPDRPKGCGDLGCDDVAHDAVLHYAYEIYLRANQMPESCARIAYLRWSDFYVMQANSYHDAWKAERAVQAPPLPPIPNNQGK